MMHDILYMIQWEYVTTPGFRFCCCTNPFCCYVFLLPLFLLQFDFGTFVTNPEKYSFFIIIILSNLKRKYIAMLIWVASFCAVLTGLAFFYTVTLWILIYMYRQKPIVAMSQPGKGHWYPNFIRFRFRFNRFDLIWSESSLCFIHSTTYDSLNELLYSFIFPFPFISSFYLSHTILVLVLVIEFLYNICGGSLLIVLSMIANICVLTSRKIDSIDDNGADILTSTMSDLSINIFCGFYWWLSLIGYALVYTALLCKIYRIKLITDQPLRRGVKILPKHVMIPYAIIMVTIIILFIAWFMTMEKNLRY